MIRKDTCDRCRFAGAVVISPLIDYEPGTMTCRRRAPRPNGWYVVTMSDWCGEFEASPGGETSVRSEDT
jgi:hypothetical protein